MADTAAAPPRWTEYLPVAELQPAARNAKDHDTTALHRSVAEFGYLEPVVLDERTGRLVSGHGRAEYLAEQEASGHVEPPDGVTTDEQGRWLVLVTRGWRSRDDAHAEAAGIALNRVGERGGWKPDVLTEALDGMWGTDLAAATGWTADELDDLIASSGGGGPTPEFEPGGDQPRLDQGRQTQGLHEVGLMFSAEQHREFNAAVAKLRAAWHVDAAPSVVLRAVTDAAASA